MTEADDRPGVLAGLVLGFAAGAVLAVPAIPEGSLTLTVGSFTIGTVGAVLLVSALSVLLLPLGLFSLYQLFSIADR